MPADLVLHELPPSPNNRRARLALGYKRLVYARLTVPAGDRSEVIALTRQPRTPVLVHAGRVVYDSFAILRYLDANFPETPSLFSTDYATFGRIEEWELWTRVELAKPVGLIFPMALAGQVDEPGAAEASRLLNQAAARIEERLADRPFLMGESLTAADLAPAPVVALGALDPAAGTHPVLAFFAQHLHLGEGRERTREWLRRVLVHDV